MTINEAQFSHVIEILSRPDPDTDHAFMHLDEIVTDQETLAQVICGVIVGASEIAKKTGVFTKREGGFYAQEPPLTHDPEAALRVVQILNAYLNGDDEDGRTLTIQTAVGDSAFALRVLAQSVGMFIGTVRLVRDRPRRWFSRLWRRKK